MFIKHESLPCPPLCEPKRGSQPPPLIAAPQPSSTPLLSLWGTGPANIFSSEPWRCGIQYATPKADEFEWNLFDEKIDLFAKEEKEENDAFVTPTTADAFPKTLSQALSADLKAGWQPTVHDNQEMIKTASINIAKLLRYKLTVVGSIKNSRHYRKRQMIMEPSVFKLIASKLMDNEIIKQPKNKKQSGVWQVRIQTLDRAQALFGTHSLVCHFTSLGSSSIIAPKGYILEDGCKLQGSHQGTDFLAISECTYVALLREVEEYYHCFAPARGADEPFVEVLGVCLRGRVGLVPKALVAMHTPFTINYSTNTRLFKVVYNFFPFNHNGLLIGNNYANLDYAAALVQKRKNTITKKET